VGGRDAGEAGERTGSGYCRAGHTGPRCQVCVGGKGGVYFDRESGTCRTCPKVQERLVLPGIVLGALLVLLALGLRAYQTGGTGTFGALIVASRRLIVRIQQLELVARLKLIFAFYQLATTLSSVYSVELPQMYYDAVGILHGWVRLEWDNYLMPGDCIGLDGFSDRLVLRALAPLGLIGITFILSTLRHTAQAVVCSVLRRSSRVSVDSSGGSRWARGCAFMKHAVVSALPFSLLVSFCLVPSVSQGIFAAWGCDPYQLDADAATERSFLHEDLRIVCWDGEHGYTAAHQEITSYAFIFIAIWPIGLPCAYVLLLLLCRKAVRQRRETPLARATRFLHREYIPDFYFWEVLPLLQRLIISGWLLLIPAHYEAWRIFLGLLTAVGYLTLLQFVQPYKRATTNTIAIAAQFSLVCVFLGGTFIKVFVNANGADECAAAADDDGNAADEANNRAKLRVVVIMIFFNFMVLTLFLGLALYQFTTIEVLPSVRLAETRLMPELRLKPGQTWHIFLSHIWSSGQDQMAAVKRQLQLLLPGVRCFLDVDDLEEIGSLETYIQRSLSVLIFLSKNYFFSGNCKKEVAATLTNGNPIILLHEADLNRGGAPLAQLRDEDCPRDWHDRVFGTGAAPREIITWFRLKDFQLVSLKMVVSLMLRHQSGWRSGYSGGLSLDEGKPTEGRKGREGRMTPCDTAAAAAAAPVKESVQTTADSTAYEQAQEARPSEAQLDSAEALLKRALSSSRSDVQDGEGAEQSVPTDIPGQLSMGKATSTCKRRKSSLGSNDAKPELHRRSQSNAAAVQQPCAPLGSDLYVPGEVTHQNLDVLQRMTVFVSDHNPGARWLAEEMARRYSQLKLAPVKIGDLQLRVLRDHGGVEISAGSGDRGALQASGDLASRMGLRSKREFYLLYLNNQTFVGAAGASLAAEVRTVRKAGIKVVLAHECDPERGGCEFEEVSQSTPDDLIQAGLYLRRGLQIAVEFKSSPQHREVSYCMLAKDLGATKSKRRAVVAARAEQWAEDRTTRRASASCLSKRESGELPKSAKLSSGQTSRRFGANSKPESTGELGSATVPTADGGEVEGEILQDRGVRMERADEMSPRPAALDTPADDGGAAKAAGQSSEVWKAQMTQISDLEASLRV
jgi:hypothetical protein